MISKRTKEMTSFIVMDILERANEMEREGADIVHLEVGEPDFDTPACVKAAACKALDEGHTHYTHSLGLYELRENISEYFLNTYQVSVDPDQIVVTSGSSPAIFINSPSNPTGNLLSENRMRQIAAMVDKPDAPYVVSDEIYHGLVYEGKEHSILEYTDRAFVVNGFSNTFPMTRISWPSKYWKRLGLAWAPELILEKTVRDICAFPMPTPWKTSKQAWIGWRSIF